MDFFDKLGKKASAAYKVTADKTGKIAKETKLKFKIGELKSQISEIYEEIGHKVYEKHIREEELSIKNDLEEQCTKIDVLSDEIDGLLKQCMDLKDKKQCSNCYKEIDKEYNYCPNCGFKQEIEELDDSYKGKDDNRGNQENNSDKEQESNNITKQQKNDKNKEKQKQENKIDEEIKNIESRMDLQKTVEVESNPKI